MATELHAHLSGSLSRPSILRMLKQNNKTETEALEKSCFVGEKQTLEECFKIFSVIHSLTSNLQLLEELTKWTIEEFAEDGVVYLELRTTPKSLEGVYTKKEYIDTVVKAILSSMESYNIVVRLLLSFDRARGLKDAEDTVNLLKYNMTQDWRNIICGIDVSGNPKSGDLKDFVDILKEVKKLELKCSVHLLEVNTNLAIEEAHDVIKLNLVDRIGHGSFVHPKTGGNDIIYDMVKNKKIPFEICLSSNLKSGVFSRISDHHVKCLLEDGHPFVICTDDKGVFSTDLSAEFSILLQEFEDINLKQIYETSAKSAFIPDSSKEKLCHIWDTFSNN